MILMKKTYFLLKSLDLKCHACFSTICMLLHSNSLDAYLIVIMHYIYIYIFPSCDNFVENFARSVNILSYTLSSLIQEIISCDIYIHIWSVFEFASIYLALVRFTL